MSEYTRTEIIEGLQTELDDSSDPESSFINEAIVMLRDDGIYIKELEEQLDFR